MLFKKKKINKKTKQNIGDQLDFPSVEAYNLLRTNLAYSFPGKGSGKIIGITSPSPSEGKSFTAINLAYSIAKNDQKVLLIDGDMRKPSVSDKIQIPLAPGLSNYLITPSEEYFQKGVLHENLTILTAGDIPPNPSELLGSDEMKNFLDQLRTQYEYIILDLPPVLEVVDPLVASKNLDGVLVVLMHEQSRRRNTQETVRKLKFAQVRILGFVYNGYSLGKSGYYKKKHYQKYGYYKYGYYKRNETKKEESTK